MLLVAEIIELADFVRNLLAEKNLSTYDVARNSGNRISAATVTKIINREIKSNSIQTLDALADGLRIPKEEIYNVVRGLPAHPSRFEIYAETFDAKDLTDSDWKVLENYFEQQVRQWQALKSSGTAEKPAAKQKTKKKTED